MIDPHSCAMHIYVPAAVQGIRSRIYMHFAHRCTDSDLVMVPEVGRGTGYPLDDLYDFLQIGDNSNIFVIATLWCGTGYPLEDLYDFCAPMH